MFFFAPVVFARHCDPTGVKILLVRVSRVRVEVRVRVRVAQSRVDGRDSAGPGRDAKKNFSRLAQDVPR